MQMRKTFQKALTLEAVNEINAHPTADQVYAYVAQKYPEISRATIYRNLNQLSETGEICRFKNPCGADHYEPKKDMHCHFVCKSCGKISDIFFDGNISQQLERSNEKLGCEVSALHVTLEGICKDCREKN